MSREYRQLILEAKAAPPEGEGGAELEEKRGLLSAGRVGVNTWRGNAGTSRAQGRLGQMLGRHNSGRSLNKPKGKLKRRRMMGSRLEGALGYLNTRSARNEQRRGVSFGDR